MILFTISHNSRQKTEVKYFVCDMNPYFREVAKTCFPKAAVVADRYHVIRQAYWAMERVRKNEQNKLSDEELDKLSLMFEIAPRLADAYQLKNEFLKVIHSDSSKTRKWICLNLATAPEHIATGSKKS